MLKEAWNIIENRYRIQMYESLLVEQWYELDEMPSEFEDILDTIVTFPFATKTTPLLKAALEHSIMSSIQAQLHFESYTKFFIVEVSLKVFNRLEDSKLFKTVQNELAHASCVIQKHWKECISNPDYKMCVRRLMWEFENMVLHR
jgi:hypothetical protein